MTYVLYALIGFLVLLYVPWIGGILVDLLRNALDFIEFLFLDMDTFLIALSCTLTAMFCGMLVCAFVQAWWTFGCFVVTFLILLRIYTKP